MDEKPKAYDKFRQEIEDLKDQLLKMAGLAEAALNQVIKALLTRDSDLAREVIHGDKAINDLEEELDEACVRIVALYETRSVNGLPLDGLVNARITEERPPVQFGGYLQFRSSRKRATDENGNKEAAIFWHGLILLLTGQCGYIGFIVTVRVYRSPYYYHAII